MIFNVFLTGLLWMCLPHNAAFADETINKKQDLSFVLSQAYKDNPVLKSARSELYSTFERLPQAHAGWRPTISADGSVLVNDSEGSNFGGASGSTSKAIGVDLTQPLYRGGRTLSDIDSAQNVIDAQRLILKASEQEVMLDVATSFMDVLRDKALLDLSKNNRNLVAEQWEATKDRYNVGELSRTDVAQAEARLARAESDVISAKGNLESSKARYEQAVGAMPAVLVYEDMDLGFPGTLEESIVKARDHNPDILAADFLHRAAQEDTDGIFGELLPSLDMTASWNRQFDPQPGLIAKSTDKSIGISASIPLYQAGSVSSRVREAKHTANKKFADKLVVMREVRQETISNWESWQAAKAEIDSRQAQVDASKIAREGVRAEADLGARTVLDSLDADQELLDAQVALATARRNEVVARFALASTLGLLTPENLGFPEFERNFEKDLKTVEWKFFGTNVDIIDK